MFAGFTRERVRGPRGPLSDSHARGRDPRSVGRYLQVWLPGLPLQLPEQHWLPLVQLVPAA